MIILYFSRLYNLNYIFSSIQQHDKLIKRERQVDSWFFRHSKKKKKQQSDAHTYSFIRKII